MTTARGRWSRPSAVASRPAVTVGAGADLARASRARRRRAQRSDASGSSRSTRSARRRRPGPAGRERCGCGCSRAPVRSCRSDLDRVAGIVRDLRRRSTWSWCCRTGARSTRTSTVRDQRGRGTGSGRRRCRPRRRRPPALGAGRRGRPGRLRRLLAGQLRLRHGLHAADPGGRAARADLLGARAQGRPARAVRDRRGLRATASPAGARGDAILDDVWRASSAPLRGTHAR